MFQSFWGPVAVAECGGVCEQDLIRAASGNSVEPLTKFAEAGGALHHVRDTEERTLLHVAAFDGSFDVLKLLLRFPKMIQLLNIKDKSHRTALHLAAAGGDEACARRLVEAGASQDQRDVWGCTPLHHSIKWDHVGTVRVLLELASDPSLVDADGRSAADMAESVSKDVAEILKSFVPRKKPTTFDGLRCCLRPRRAPARRPLVEEPCDDELDLEREAIAQAPPAPQVPPSSQAPSSPQSPPTPQEPPLPRAPHPTPQAPPSPRAPHSPRTPSPRTPPAPRTTPAPQASPSPQLPAPSPGDAKRVIPPPPVQGRSPERDFGHDRHSRDRSRNRDRSRDREGVAAAFKVGHRVRVRDGDRERWQLGRVTSLKPVKVQTDTSSHSFVWVQVEIVKDEGDGDDDIFSSTSEEPPPPPPLPAEGRALNGDNGGASSGDLSAYITEAAKRRVGSPSPPVSPPRPSPGLGLEERSSPSEAGDNARGEVEWHGLEPVYKARASGSAHSGVDARSHQSDMQSRVVSADARHVLPAPRTLVFDACSGQEPSEVDQYRALSAPPGQPQCGTGFVVGTQGNALSWTEASGKEAGTHPGGGEVSDSEVFTDSEESAKKGGQTSPPIHWSMEQSFLLANGDASLRGVAPLMDSERCSSVRDAVDQLNGGNIEVPGGICTVFSRARSAYFLLYRQDKVEYALAEFGQFPQSTGPRELSRTAELPAKPVSTKQLPPTTSALSGVSHHLPRGPLLFRFRGHFSESIPRLEFEVEWKSDPPMVGKTKPGGAAEVRGILTGDLISEVNGISTVGRSRDDLLPMLKNRPLLLSVDRVYRDVGELEAMLTLELALEHADSSSDHGMELTSADRDGHDFVLIVAGVRENSPAWVSGVLVGDAVVAVGGHNLGKGSVQALRLSKHTWPLELKLQRWALGSQECGGDAAEPNDEDDEGEADGHDFEKDSDGSR